ncbi:zinc finger protein 442 [Caerostris darwini]|uniref:Zinc finger protein 442 n=1 Tax=Caerostris darwini TaxID=1538125 RepID=A0AAV4RE46_9ARAC|nr:zinc finger protein 442 [Caerostris darwini]
MADSLQDVYTLQIRRQKNCSVSPFCEACKTGCIHVNSIQVRQFTQSGKLPGICKTCNVAFLKICRLQIRHLTQNEHQPHLCSKCGKSFTHAGNHRKHMLLHERDDTEGGNGIKSPLNHPKPPFKCEKCDRNFLKYGSFTKHILSHDQKFICGMCDKAFNTKQLLKGHMHSHKIDLPFHPCKFCKATFQIPEELEKHLVEHVQNQNEELQNEPKETESEPEIDTEPKVSNEMSRLEDKEIVTVHLPTVKLVELALFLLQAYKYDNLFKLVNYKEFITLVILLFQRNLDYPFITQPKMK